MFQAKEAVRLVLNGVAVGVACGPRLPANPAGLGAPTTAAATSLPTTDRIKTGIKEAPEMTTTEVPVDNGVNVEALLGVRGALADTPQIAQFQWRSTVSWVNGTHSRSDVETFYGFGEEQQHHTRFSYDVDHPLQFAAQDNGVTPVEYVLVALGSCLTAGVAAVAQQRSIQLRSVRATLAAEMDLHGILGADPDVRNGFSGVSVSYQIDADATAEEIRALVAQSQKRSAVYDILTNPTSVTVDVS
jgi:uncharacterized OsmC-like protein